MDNCYGKNERNDDRGGASMIERTFFSVGQALFCRGQVDNRTIIYDCESQTEAIVKSVIDAEYPVGNNSVIGAFIGQQ